MTAVETRSAASMPIATAPEARAALGRLDEAIDALDALVVQESALVRAGRLVEVAGLAARKEELARRYHADAQRIKECLPRLRGEIGGLIEQARTRHGQFRIRLQASLTVLATAHAVSEGIVRGLSQELNRKAAPQTYGASGRATPAQSAYASPLALSRTL